VFDPVTVPPVPPVPVNALNALLSVKSQFVISGPAMTLVAKLLATATVLAPSNSFLKYLFIVISIIGS
jgi:hypothetical protein